MPAREEELPAGDEDRESKLLAEIETLKRFIQAREQEVEGKEDEIQELAKHLKDTATENSDLKAQLHRSEHENSLLDRKCKEATKSLNNLDTQHKRLYTDHGKIARMNSNLGHEIEALRDTNNKINTELKTRVAQLNKFTGEIARQTQRVNTSAIRDDEYFKREFAGLAKEIRHWSFTHFPSHLDTGAGTSGLWDAIHEIAGGTYLIEISKNRTADRRLVVGLLASRLKEELFDPFLLGLLPEEFTKFENMIEKTSKRIGPFRKATRLT